jgi:ephrin-A
LICLGFLRSLCCIQGIYVPGSLTIRPRNVIYFHCSLSLSLSPSSGPPSAPRNVISVINETSVILDWSWPEDTGGRKDVTFTVLCKRCRQGQRVCEACRSNVRFLPRAAGLQNTTVTVGDLLAHTNYTFEIEAQNGVSQLAPTMRQYAAVTITTNQAGTTRDEDTHMNVHLFI